MNGLLLVDKPKGWTSFDVVAKVRAIIKSDLKKRHEQRGFCTEVQGKKAASNGVKRTETYVEQVAEPADTAMRSEPIGAASFAGRQDWRCKCQVKVGHTGTLDPLATGLLVICIGSYCKKAGQYSKLDKTYEVELELGKTSTTDDAEGEVTPTQKPIPDTQHVKSAIADFIGTVEQVPPVFSAIKVDGKRAYKLAREGKQVKLEPRTVTVYEITDIEVTGAKVSFNATVSSGTYIRSLVRDIGEKLDVGAYMTSLRRTKVGDFSINDAQEINSLTIDKVGVALIE